MLVEFFLFLFFSILKGIKISLKHVLASSISLSGYRLQRAIKT